LPAITRKISFPGRYRLVRLLFNPDKQHSYCVDGSYQGMKIDLDLAFLIDWSIYFFGDYEPEVTKVIKKVVKPTDTVIDVGAHIGVYSLLMAKLARKVISIEPVPELNRKLEVNIRRNNLQNVKIFPWVLSNKEEALDFYYPVNQPIGREGNLYQINLPLETIKVQVHSKKLDQLVAEEGLPAVNFIKVDVDGHELPILYGARKTLEIFKPIILFEYDLRTWSNAGCSFQEARQFLKNLGYTLERIHPTNVLAQVA